MEQNEKTNKYVQRAYEELDHYIVIGLTGRCGSGCSTTRDILCGDSRFNPEDFLANMHIEDLTNEDRDQSIILNFAIHNPTKFEVIRVRDILTSYILDAPNAFFEVLNEIFPDQKGDGKKIKSDFYVFFKENYKSTDCDRDIFDSVSEKSSKIWTMITNNVYQFIQEIDEQQYNFLFNELKKISDIIREYFISKHSNNAYTLVYQYIGNIVRTYGELKKPEELYVQDDIKAKSMYAVARRINLWIKIMRRKQWIINNYKREIGEGKREPIEKSSVHVVIDSIKNVFEADYLKARYQSFYLVALTLDDERRKQRLKLKKGLDEFQIEVLDAREQPSKIKNLLRNNSEKIEEWDKTGEMECRMEATDVEAEENKSLQQRVYERLFYSGGLCSAAAKRAFEDGTYMFIVQDVDSCIQKADILINNSGSKEELSLKIMRYVCLMQHPGLVPPTEDERCMQIAQSAKLNSGCISRRVGAVVSDKSGNILSIGWNDAPSLGENECISCIRRSFLQLVSKEDELAYSYYELCNEEFRRHIIQIMKKNCQISQEEIDSNEVYNRFVKEILPKTQGLPITFCFKDMYCSLIHDRNQVHTRAQHGEENALEACDKDRCKGGTLYTTSSSCELCAKKALHYDIKRIVYIEPYSGITNDHVLGHAVKQGVKIRRDKVVRTESMNVELFTGATQSAYVRLYTPVFPLKDELKLRGIDLQ